MWESNNITDDLKVIKQCLCNEYVINCVGIKKFPIAGELVVVNLSDQEQRKLLMKILEDKTSTKDSDVTDFKIYLTKLVEFLIKVSIF